MVSHVIQLREKLQSALDSQNNVIDMSVALDVLGELARTPMTREILERTRVGKCINEVRKAPACEKQFAKRCRLLINAWQSLLAAPSGEAVIADNWIRQQDNAPTDESRKPKRAKHSETVPDLTSLKSTANGLSKVNTSITPLSEQRPSTPNGALGNGAIVNGVHNSKKHAHSPLNNGDSLPVCGNNAAVTGDKRPAAGLTYVTSSARSTTEHNRWTNETKSSSATPSPAASTGSKLPHAKSTVELLAELCSANSAVKRIVDESQTAKLVMTNRIAIERCDEPDTRSTPASPSPLDAEKLARRSKKITKSQSVTPLAESTVSSPTLPKLCIKLGKPGANEDSPASLQTVFRFEKQPTSEALANVGSLAASPQLPSKPRKYADVEDDDDVIDLTFERGRSDIDEERLPVSSPSTVSEKRSKKRQKSGSSSKNNAEKSNSLTNQSLESATDFSAARRSGAEPLLQRAIKNAAFRHTRRDHDANEYDAKRDEAKLLGALDFDAIDWNSLDYSLEKLYADSPLVARQQPLGVLQPSDVLKLPSADDGAEEGLDHRLGPNISSSSNGTSGAHDASESDVEMNGIDNAERNPTDQCSTQSRCEIEAAATSEWTAVNGTRDAALSWRPWTAAYKMPSHTVVSSSASADDAVVIVMPYVVLDRFAF